MNRERVERELMLMGFRVGMSGFRYLVDALEAIYDSNDKPSMMYLYKEVAEKNGSVPSSAERNIRYEITTYYSKNTNYPPELTPDYWKGKLTNTEFLMRLRSMMKEKARNEQWD